MSHDLGSPIGHRELIRRMQAQKAAEARSAAGAPASAAPHPVAEQAESETVGPRARLRASRNEMTGQFYALSHEDRLAFTQHCDCILSDLDPQNHRERWLAVSIAEDQWRLNRARALENNIFALGMSGTISDATAADTPEVHAAVCQARVWLQDGRQLQMLSLYEQRIRRSIEKNEKQLKELQAERKAAEEKAREEAILLAQLAIAENREWDPGADAAAASPLAPQGSLSASGPRNGFAFSTSEIIRLAHRRLRLLRAARCREQAWLRPSTAPKAA